MTETPVKQIWNLLGEEGLHRFKLTELKDELRHRNLILFGNKKEVIEKLHKHFLSMEQNSKQQQQLATTSEMKNQSGFTLENLQKRTERKPTTPDNIIRLECHTLEDDERMRQPMMMVNAPRVVKVERLPIPQPKDAMEIVEKKPSVVQNAKPVVPTPWLTEVQTTKPIIQRPQFTPVTPVIQQSIYPSFPQQKQFTPVVQRPVVYKPNQSNLYPHLQGQPQIVTSQTTPRYFVQQPMVQRPVNQQRPVSQQKPIQQPMQRPIQGVVQQQQRVQPIYPIPQFSQRQNSQHLSHSVVVTRPTQHYPKK